MIKSKYRDDYVCNNPGAGYSKAFKFNLSISCSRNYSKTTYLIESVYSKLRLAA